MVRPSWAVAFVFQLCGRSDSASPPVEAFMARIAAITALLLAALAATVCTAIAGTTSLHIELNRLEERDDGCRVHLVLENGSSRAYSSYRLDLVIFATDGVIARRLALEAAPLRANKTVVKEFELAGFDCGRVGRVLLNDVPACASDAGELDDCVASTRVSSRASASFVK
jgi:hypothetical protein